MAEAARYTLIDLFAGCGGMTRGFHDTGRFESIFAVEFDTDAAATYTANFPDVDMRPIPIEDVDHFPKTDVVIGGPPCQGFSPLNRNLVGFERRGLWRHYLMAVDGHGSRCLWKELYRRYRSMNVDGQYEETFPVGANAPAGELASCAWRCPWQDWLRKRRG